MKDNGCNLNDTNSEPFYSENLEEDLEEIEHTWFNITICQFNKSISSLSAKDAIQTCMIVWNISVRRLNMKTCGLNIRPIGLRIDNKSVLYFQQQRYGTFVKMDTKLWPKI